MLKSPFFCRNIFLTPEVVARLFYITMYRFLTPEVVAGLFYATMYRFLTPEGAQDFLTQPCIAF